LANYDLPLEALKGFICSLLSVPPPSPSVVSGQNGASEDESCFLQPPKTHFEKMLQLFRNLIHPLSLRNLSDLRYFGYSAYLNSCDRMVEEFFMIFQSSDLTQVAKRVLTQLRRVQKAEELWEYVHGRQSIERMIEEVEQVYELKGWNDGQEVVDWDTE
jgi:hypothetical protein